MNKEPNRFDLVPNHFDLVPADFTGDIDFQLMTAEQRGIYCTVIFYMYQNQGYCNLDSLAIATLCHCENLEKTWLTVAKKFVKTKRGLTHSRVLKEYARSKGRMQIAVNAGVKGAAVRWGSQNKPDGVAIADGIATQYKGTVHKDTYTYTDDFEIFWKAYPKKVGKGKAFESWQKIKPSAELQAKILRAVSEQSRSAQWQKENGQYIPNPVTWLNQRRWDDSPQQPIRKKDISSCCVCGRPATSKVSDKDFCDNPECRKKKLGW